MTLIAFWESWSTDFAVLLRPTPLRGRLGANRLIYQGLPLCHGCPAGHPSSRQGACDSGGIEVKGVEVDRSNAIAAPLGGGVVASQR